MAILWCGGEDIDFPNGSAVSITTTGTYFRSAYSRCAICANSEGTTSKSKPFSGGAVTSAWLSSQIYHVSPGYDVTCGIGLGLSTLNSGLFFGATKGGYATIYKRNDVTETLLATSSSLVFGADTTVKKVDFHVSGYGATATVNVYIAGVLAVTYTGDVTVTGMTNFDSVYISRQHNLGIFQCSEIAVSSTDTRNMIGLKTLAPTADGTTTDWTGDYSAVDEITISDADVDYSDTNAQDQEFAISDLPAGTFTIPACKIAVRTTKSEDASIGNIALGWLSGTVAVGSNQALTTAWATYEELDTVNPVTSNPWLQSEMNDLQINLRSAT